MAGISLVKLFQMNITDAKSGNGLMPLGMKSSPEPMLTQSYVFICCYQAIMGYFAGNISCKTCTSYTDPKDFSTGHAKFYKIKHNCPSLCRYKRLMHMNLHHTILCWSMVFRCALQRFLRLTHWSRLWHICVSKLSILGSYNGLSPGRRQAII